MIDPNNKVQIENNIEVDYLTAYIGKNYKNVKKGLFSIITLIFGPLHLIYKKIYILGIILLGVLGITYYYNTEVGLLLTIILNIILSFNFNKLYYKHAIRKIDEIKISNPNKTEEELLEICKQRGKPLISLIIFILLFIIIIFSMIPILLKPKEKEIITDNQSNDLFYKIPKGFEAGNYNSNKYKTYHYEDCKIVIKVQSNTNINQYIKTYLKKDMNNLPTKTINNWNWKEIEDNIVIEINNQVYDVSYKITNDNPCKELKEEFISSLDFKEIDQ